MESITEEVYEKARNKKAWRHDSGPSDHDKLEDAQVTRYRALVARANYLAVDRGDIAFCVKELARRMSSPSRTGLGKASEAGEVPATQASMRTLVCISRHTPARSLASLTATWARMQKKHVDPHPVDALFGGGRTLSRCGAGRKHW